MKISGTIITYNEADQIEDCINSMKPVCDEIIVVDSLSTDKTVEIAERMGATVIHQAYLGEGKQRQVTEKHCSHDWILALDADERVDSEMAAAIKELTFTDEKVGYEFNRKSYVGDRWIKGPGFYPDFLVRLYNRKHSGYISRYSHAGVESPAKSRVAGHIDHYTYDSLTDWIAKINQVTSLDAQGLYEKGRPPSNLKPILSATSAFFQKLIIKGGIFKGMDGLTITLTTVFRSYMKYMKLNELHMINSQKKK